MMFATKGWGRQHFLLSLFLLSLSMSVCFYVGQVFGDHGGAHPTTTYFITVDIYYSAGTSTRPAIGICPDGTTINGHQTVNMYHHYREWYYVTEYYSGHKKVQYHGTTYQGLVGFGTGQYVWYSSCPPASGSNSVSNN